MLRKFLISLLLALCLLSPLDSLLDQRKSKIFVNLNEVDPTILISLRYCSQENFTGATVPGYKRQTAMVLEPIACALKKVQQEVKKDGYGLVIYDTYRPEKAVTHFLTWSKNSDQSKKAVYYPRVNKAQLASLGYIEAGRSSHATGKAVDLTLIKADKPLKQCTLQNRRLADGFTFKLLDDGTIDMGTSFDFFDKSSYTESKLVSLECYLMRHYLKKVMEKHGFRNYHREWWHYTYIASR